MGFDGMITKGYIRIDPNMQRAAHRAILALDGAASQSGTPLGYPCDPGEVMRRATVRLPQRCLESEDVWEAIASWGSFYMAAVPSYVPRDMQFQTNAKGEAWEFRDEWRRIARDADLWYALTPYLRRLVMRYEGDGGAKWCYQREASDGLVWEWVPERGRGWRKVAPLIMEPLRRPKPLHLGWTRVTSHEGGKVEQYEVHLGTGERRAWADATLAERPVVTLGPNNKR
jgi:hypothetical protein